jgi:EAL domain-containing protein (putative c-di-GMP-specific phosphodiesterase class I)
LQKELHTRFGDTFEAYRYSGDEFALLIEGQTKGSLLKKVFQIVQKLKTDLVLIEEIEINLTLSCGISFEPISYLLSSADMALKTSKKEKKNFVVYTQENDLNQKYENNLLWAKRVKNAIEENRVEPFFQEIVNNTNLANKKYEALVRIVQSDGTVITPFHFLEIAKQTKQYLQLTQIMIEKSFEVFKNRENEFSINLTMEDLTSYEMRDFLHEKLHENPEIAKRVVIELVETESLQDYDLVIDFIKRVKSHGCKIAIDDFGSGYSNFEYLIKLQADYIKIDGSLIQHINRQRESYVVVSTIVSFAKQMGIKTIAEFIENEEIFQTVKELGIDYSQGYYFSPPRSKTEI